MGSLLSVSGVALNVTYKLKKKAVQSYTHIHPHTHRLGKTLQENKGSKGTFGSLAKFYSAV